MEGDEKCPSDQNMARPSRAIETAGEALRGQDLRRVQPSVPSTTCRRSRMRRRGRLSKQGRCAARKGVYRNRKAPHPPLL